MTEGIITLHKDREKPVRNRHPWLFSGAIARAENAEPGDIVIVVDSNNDFLARGYWNPRSQIQVRLLTWIDESIDEDWWRRQLDRAINARALTNIRHNEGEPLAYRLVNAENDFLPGLIVDRYVDWLIIQSLTLGIDRRKSLIVDLLADLLKPVGIYERSDVEIRDREGLKSTAGLLSGGEPPEHITILESTEKFLVDVRNGHKTGFYLDQSQNRRLIYDLLSEDFEGSCRFLNVFSYTGGFAIFALGAGGVQAINVDSSREHLELAEQNIILNNYHTGDHGTSYELIQADAFVYLRDAAVSGEQFDIVVLDPPKFAHTKQQATRASRGYKDLNLNAFRVIKPGGYLMTFSCSGAISPDLFQKIVFGALVDAGRQAQIIKYLGPGPDHPVALTFPEGAYLKGLLLRVY